MSAKYEISPLWQTEAPAIESRLRMVFDRAPKGTVIFFRADDIGIPGEKMAEMLRLFRKHDLPLNLAVVPGWIGEERWSLLLREAMGSERWCWHQHGWQHKNHQTKGKKCEFGDERSYDEKKDDVAKGRNKLSKLLGEHFSMYFTPPWNRFDAETGDILLDLGFQGCSRTVGAEPEAPIPDYGINVDLHTRKETDPGQSMTALLDELGQALESGRCGVMLHHQRMNDNAFRFLDILLTLVARDENLRPLTFEQIS